MFVTRYSLPETAKRRPPVVAKTQNEELPRRVGAIRRTDLANPDPANPDAPNEGGLAKETQRGPSSTIR
ncbi:hypothetical protein ACVIJ6_005718 [Bradyrhizobium sp. USDA 4369]